MKKIIFALSALLLSFFSINAASISSNPVSGTWNDPATWVGGIVPTSDDDVILAAGSVITLTEDATCKSITYPTTGDGDTSLDLITFTLTVLGNVTIGAPGTNNTENYLKVANGAFSCQNLTMNGASTGRSSRILINTGILTVNGTFSVTNASNSTLKTVRLTEGGTLVFNGDVSAGAFTFTLHHASTVKYMKNGDKQVHSATTGFDGVYGNLVLGGGGNTSFRYGNVSVASSLTMAGTVVKLDGKTLNILDGATVDADVAQPFGVNNMIETTNSGATTFGQLFVFSNTPDGFQQTYPLGLNGVYTPMVISHLDAFISTGASIRMRVIGNKHAGVVGDNYINRYWEIATANITAVNSITGYLQYATADVVGDAASLSKAAKFYNGAWTLGDAATVNAATNRIALHGSDIRGNWTAVGVDGAEVPKSIHSVGGAGANYNSLKAAFDAINAGVIYGDIVLQMIGNSIENSSNITYSLLNSANISGANYSSVLIYPTVDNVRIEGNTNANLRITLNGADNVTLDGRKRNANGDIISQDINMSFNGRAGNLFTFSNAATNNTIRYCNLTVNGSTGNIITISNDGLGGSDNNSFEYNNIGASNLSFATNGISVVSAALGNETDNLVIRNNNFFNCIRTGANGNFISIGNFARNFTISGNSFYLTSGLITTSSTYRVISLAGTSNSGHLVENNFIGGSGPLCDGKMFIDRSTEGVTLSLDIITISKANSAGSGIIVRNNIIKNIEIGANATGAIRGIVGVGNTSEAIINQINANYISNVDVLGSANLTGMHIGAAGNFAVTNNIVNLTTNGSGTIFGITEDCNSTANSRYIYNNTVYVGGTANSDKNSIAYNYLQNNANTRRIKNNVFVNARSNAGAGKNYAIWYNTAAAAADTEHNIYSVSGTNGVLARHNTLDKNELPILPSKDANSSIVDPKFIISSPTVKSDYRTTVSQIVGGAADYDVLFDIDANSRTTIQKGAYFNQDIVFVSDNSNSSELTLSPSSILIVAPNAELSLSNDITVAKVVLAPTAKLSAGNYTINAVNGVSFESNETGTATLLGDVAINNAMIEQFVEAGRNWYLSSPVTAAAYNSLSRGTKVVRWNEVNKTWDDVLAGTLTPGMGYIQIANSNQGSTGNVQFNGTTNTGDVSVELTRTTGASTGFNLVGNPYPSYLNWADVATSNSNIIPTIWLRTKKALAHGGTYTFATVNAANPLLPEIVSNNASNAITKNIPPMQAYWVRLVNGAASNTFTVRNSMRVHLDESGNRLKAPRADERMRLRIQMSNADATDEALIYFDANANSGFDSFDSPKMMNNSAVTPDIYTKVGNERLVINGLTAVTDNMEFPLGFNLNAAATLRIKALEMSNFDLNTKVYLVDKVLNSITEFSAGAEYEFTTTAATVNNENRFSLLFKVSNITTGLVEDMNNRVSVFVNAQKQIVISDGVGSDYALYNAVGSKLDAGKVTSSMFTLNVNPENGVYFVRLNNVTTKIIIQ